MITLLLAVLVLAISMLAIKLTSMAAEIDDLRSRLMTVQRRQIMDLDRELDR